MPVTIYHNPKCSKSRQTLKLIEQRGIAPKVIEYLKTPPSAAQLKQLLKQLRLTPRELLRTKEPEFRHAGLDDPRVTDEAIIRAMVKYPKLIERPIVVAGSKAVLGRPPESVLTIL